MNLTFSNNYEIFIFTKYSYYVFVSSHKVLATCTCSSFQVDTDHLQSQDFLVGDIRVDSGRYLIFATQTQLQILQQAKRWFCEGTFKIVADPFTQLQLIHAFVKKGDSLKQIPLVFCLMSWN